MESSNGERAHGRRALLSALGSIAAISVAESSCAPTLSLEGRPCPCTADHHCCESINECRPIGAECPSEPGTGGARSGDAGHDTLTSSAGAGGAGGQTSTGGGSGTGSSGGAVDAGPPRWRSLDAPGLANYEVRDTCDLELDSNGTPYVAVRACKGCSSTTPVPPIVLKYDGGKWTPLPAQGLIPTTKHAPLVVGADGTPHLLIDNAVLSFDGTKWAERGPRVPGSITQARNFELDASDQFVVTVYDASSSLLSVVRFDGTAWRVHGNIVPSDPNGERLTLSGSTLWLAHIVDSGTSVPMLEIRRFSGTGWSIVLELDAWASAEFAVTPSETTYVARQITSPGSVIVTEAHGASWIEILNVSMTAAPNLQIGPNGALYSTTLMDGFVNVSGWDGTKWTDWDQEGLGTGSHVPSLRIAERAGRIVPYLCFSRGTDLNVMMYE